MGQASNYRRAKAEFGLGGYLVPGTIITQMLRAKATAASTAGPIKIVRMEAVLELWARTNARYRKGHCCVAPSLRMVRA